MVRWVASEDRLDRLSVADRAVHPSSRVNLTVMSRRSWSRSLRALLLALVTLAGSVPAVLADAELIDATPPAEAVLTDVPPEVRLTFDEPLSADKSSVEVRDEVGRT